MYIYVFIYHVTTYEYINSRWSLLSAKGVTEMQGTRIEIETIPYSHEVKLLVIGI